MNQRSYTLVSIVRIRDSNRVKTAPLTVASTGPDTFCSRQINRHSLEVLFRDYYMKRKIRLIIVFPVPSTVWPISLSKSVRNRWISSDRFRS